MADLPSITWTNFDLLSRITDIVGDVEGKATLEELLQDNTDVGVLKSQYLISEDAETLLKIAEVESSAITDALVGSLVVSSEPIVGQSNLVLKTNGSIYKAKLTTAIGNIANSFGINIENNTDGIDLIKNIAYDVIGNEVSDTELEKYNVIVYAKDGVTGMAQSVIQKVKQAMYDEGVFNTTGVTFPFPHTKEELLAHGSISFASTGGEDTIVPLIRNTYNKHIQWTNLAGYTTDLTPNLWDSLEGVIANLSSGYDSYALWFITALDGRTQLMRVVFFNKASVTSTKNISTTSGSWGEYLQWSDVYLSQMECDAYKITYSNGWNVGPIDVNAFTIPITDVGYNSDTGAGFTYNGCRSSNIEVTITEAPEGITTQEDSVQPGGRDTAIGDDYPGWLENQWQTVGWDSENETSVTKYILPIDTVPENENSILLYDIPQENIQNGTAASLGITGRDSVQTITQELIQTNSVGIINDIFEEVVDYVETLDNTRHIEIHIPTGSPRSKFPRQIDNRLYFSDITNDKRHIMEVYQQLLLDKHYSEATEYLRENNALNDEEHGVWVLNADVLSLFEDMIVKIDEYVDELDPSSVMRFTHGYPTDLEDGIHWVSDAQGMSFELQLLSDISGLYTGNDTGLIE